MRPWLENMIDSNKVPGLRWLDKDQKEFSINWKHAARHGWQVDTDAILFKSWAIHTGKYKDGVDNLDPKKWKANFRCAMNSLPDVEEVKCKSVNKGQQAVRVYRMVHTTSIKDKRTKTKEGKRGNKHSKAMSKMDCSDIKSCAAQPAPNFDDTSSTQENTVDSTEPQVHPHIVDICMRSEVPEFESTIEIGPDSTNDIYRRFQVSPEHSPESEDTEDFLKELELNMDKMMEGISREMALNNREPNSDPYSPSSQWSDTSSGDELDVPLYTTLSTQQDTSWLMGDCSVFFSTHL